MNTLKNVQKVSLIFFVILGLAHIVSGLMNANGYSTDLTSTINKILDIPFAITGLLYGISSLKLTFSNPAKSHTKMNAIIVLIVIGVLIGLVYINFFIPDLNAR